MSVVPEHSATKPSVARYWAFTWFPAQGLRPMVGDGVAAGEEAIRIAQYGPGVLREGFNWPICQVGPDEEISGLVYQLEVCPDSGREHVQGYVEFAKPCRFQYAQGLLGITGAHCEARKKSREACVKYCTKDESRKAGTFPALLGTLAEQDPAAYKSRQGKRTDISAMVDHIKGGKRMIECLEADPDTFVKYSRGMQEVRRIVQQAAATRIRKDLKVTVYWGKAGTGKTRAVYDKHGVENVFTLVADNSACWFDGYEGQDILLIDDFKGWIQYSMLLKILDIYPLRCPVKNSFTYAAWSRVYITSNYDPDTWYSPDHDLEALSRRFHEVKKFGDVHQAFQRVGAPGRPLPRARAVGGPPETPVTGGGAGAGGAAFAPGFTPPALRRTNATLRLDTCDVYSDDDYDPTEQNEDEGDD